MAESAALHIRPKRVILAKARGAGEGATLTALVRRDVGAEENPVEAAIELVRQQNIQNLGLALVIDWEHYSLRNAWMPSVNAADLRNALKFELEEDLDEDAANLLVPAQVIEERPDANHVLAWAATKQTIRDMLKPLESAGISPEYLPPDAVGHLGLLRTLAADLVGNPVVVLSGDELGVDLTMIDAKQRIWAHRRVLDFSWATDAAGRPLQEIRRTFLSTPGFNAAAAVVSFGGEPADTLARVVADELECPCRNVPAPQLEGGSHMLYWPTVAGVALFMAASSERPLSYRLEEFEPRESAAIASLLSVVATVLLGICFAVGGVMFLQKTNGVAREAATYQQNVDEFWKSQSLPKANTPTLDLFKDRLTQRDKKLHTQVEELQKNVDATTKFSILAELIASVPPDVSIDLQQFDITGTGLGLIGKCNSFEAATKLLNQMKATPELAMQGGKEEFTGKDQSGFNFQKLYRQTTPPAKSATAKTESGGSPGQEGSGS